MVKTDVFKECNILIFMFEVTEKRPALLICFILKVKKFPLSKYPYQFPVDNA